MRANLLLIPLLLLLGACTEHNSNGNAEAYSGHRPPPNDGGGPPNGDLPPTGRYFLVDTRASCLKAGTTITGYRAEINVTAGQIEYRKACDLTATNLNSGDVLTSPFGKSAAATSGEAVLSFQAGSYDRLATAPDSSTSNVVTTHSQFRLAQGGKRYQLLVRGKGTTDTLVSGRGYLFVEGSTDPIVDSPVTAAQQSNTRTYFGSQFDLSVRYNSDGTSTATFNTTVAGLPLTLTSNDGADKLLTPAPPAESIPDVRLSAGNAFSCGSLNGKGFCWGFGSLGQMGNGGTNGTNLVPVPMSLLTSGITDMAASVGSHACASRGNGVYCWGGNKERQLGLGSGDPERSTPGAVTLASNTPPKVTTGQSHSCAIADGRAYCWGDNERGQLGGTLLGPDAIVTLPPMSGEGLAGIAAGARHTCAISGHGNVYCWGDNTYGQLGRGFDGGSSNSPALIAGINLVAISAFNNFTCGITSAGAVACWGENNYAQVTGQNPTTSGINTPGIVMGLAGPVTSLSVGSDHGCAIQNGQVVCWGSNSGGQLGTGQSTGMFPVTPVVGLANQKPIFVSAGKDHTLLRTATGLYAWGSNTFGQLGDGFGDSFSVPVIFSFP